jgi:magnesium transporter
MIRSLLAERHPKTNNITLRRNLEQSDLGAAVRANHNMAWIDVVNPTREEVDWLTELFRLSPAVTEDLLRADRRPSLLVYPTHLFLSFFQPYLQAGQVRGHEIHCIVTDNCFITVRPSAADAFEDAYDRAAQNSDAWENGSPYLLYLTAQHIVDAYYPLLDRMSNQLNSLEEKLLDSNLKDTADEKWRKPVYRIKQQLINLRQMVAPQREVLSSVIGESRLGETDNIRDLFRHLYERLLRVYDVIDSQRDLSSNVLDMMQNLESRKMVEAVNRLTILSMIFLPLTFLSAWFELGFATTSEPIELPISGAAMFVIIVGGMILSTIALTLFFRRRGWV